MNDKSDKGPRPGFETVYVGDRATARRLRKGRVLIVDGPDRGKLFELDKPRITVGRSSICEIKLADRSVSGSHAEFEANEAGFVVRDLGSTNGVFLGEARLREAVVPVGTRLRMGTSTLQIVPADGVVEVPLSTEDRYHDMVGRSVAMRQVFAQLERLGASDVTVLINGETGTGKELVARALHKASRRAKGPLVVQDCSAMPQNLVESTLFGHERGSFTGASERRVGAFEQAQHGTLFLDEVGELPLDQQSKLLRALENREVRRVGGTQTIAVDARVVAATNRDLRQMVSSGTFREDLYYRLAVVTVELPPLRARREDIPLLAMTLLDRFCERNPTLGAKVFDASAMGRLLSLPLPGNVRELRNLIERSASLADGAEISLSDLLPAGNVDRTPPAGVAPISAQTATQILGSLTSRESAPPVGPSSVYDELSKLPFKDAKARLLEAFEPAYLRALLASHHGNITHSAQTAGLTRYHLRELCKRYGLRATDNEPE
ncbi:MAG: sigma 54-interacting transcriptional regulator [Deltaproteobacteria bacterium]|nr:sigma 54-interacting transcriptional regulator [Deltaproteobacteria bacterium]